MRSTRALARIGAAALLAGGTIALSAGPALAQENTADLGVELTGTTLAATTSGKEVDVTLTNHGPDTATGVALVFDLTELDRDRADFVTPNEDACWDLETDVMACGVIDVKAGQAIDMGSVQLVRKAGSGDAGRLTVRVVHEGTDPDEANNAASAEVTIGESGPDLYAYAPDVPLDPETGDPGTVAPGGEANLVYAVGNYGDRPVAGVKLTITLPEHVTFVEDEAGCDYNAANTVATCTYENMPVVPVDEDTSDDDKIYSGYWFYHVITVADDAPAPANLTGGTVAVEGIAVPEATLFSKRSAQAQTPANVEGASADEVDASDNIDEYVVYVAKSTGGVGGGDEEPGLPITGVQVGVIGAVGAAIVVGGAALLLVSRRRRVVLVAPRDEKPAS